MGNHIQHKMMNVITYFGANSVTLCWYDEHMKVKHDLFHVFWYNNDLEGLLD